MLVEGKPVAAVTTSGECGVISSFFASAVDWVRIMYYWYVFNQST